MINILCATDDNYVPYCGIMLTSLFENNTQEQFDIYIMTEGLNSNNQNMLNDLVQSHQSNIQYTIVNSNSLKDCPIRTGDHVSLATYYRLLAPKLLPDKVTKILYLDCDMIINDSIKALWDTDISNFAIGAVIDESLNYPDKFDRLGYSASKGYFNAGMLLINLDYWRMHNVMERCFKCIQTMPDKLLFHDQDTLNVVLQDEKKYLPVTYNLQTGFLYQITPLSDSLKKEVLASVACPTVIHYTGPSKPWLERSQHPYASFYQYYKHLSSWSNFPDIKCSFSSKLLYYRNQLIWKLGIKKRPQTYIIPKQYK